MNSVPRAFRFILVGGLATAVHIVAGWALIGLGVAALAANPAAFAAALAFSFLGHYLYTFEDSARGAPAAFVRYFPVALLGFGLNETLLAGLLRAQLLPPAAALFVSTGAVAVLTFALLRIWAFNTMGKTAGKAAGSGSQRATGSS